MGQWFGFEEKICVEQHIIYQKFLLCAMHFVKHYREI